MNDSHYPKAWGVPRPQWKPLISSELCLKYALRLERNAKSERASLEEAVSGLMAAEWYLEMAVIRERQEREKNRT